MENISKEHLLEAIDFINENGVPSGRQSFKYDLVHEGKHYPPLYVVSLANKFATGEEFPPNTLGGGPNSEAFKLLYGHEFNIMEKAKPESPGYKEIEEFQKDWPIERLRNMTLEEYSNLDKDTGLTYWLEAKTENAGSIWGGSSYKFGIYRRRNTESSGASSVSGGGTTDGVYAWYSKYGDTKEEAFSKVKELIVAAAEAALSEDLDKIDSLDIGFTIKWKIAYLFNPDMIIPIFKHEVLYRAAEANGLKDAKRQGVGKLQQYLMQFKPEDQRTLDYSAELWGQFNLDNFYYVVDKFLRQAQTENLKQKGFPKSYKGYKVRVSFGTGNVARIPWIALLKAPNEVTNGIYPVYLYYKEVDKLILSYGTSETVDSESHWKNSNELQTIEEWYLGEYGEKPARYGDSFIKTVYDLNEELSADEMQQDLNKVLNTYEEQTFASPQIVQEDQEEYGADKRRYWIIAPGDGASEWDRFYKNGIIGISWNKVTDLTRFSSRDAVREEMLRVYPSNDSHFMNSLGMWEFSHVMKPGDILIPKKGISHYLGYGEVTGDYYHDEKGGEYPHLRKVEWKKKGEWPEEVHTIVKKTLTDITKYPEYVDRLKRLIGIEQKAVIPETINYWWLNANPKYWKITDFAIGQEQSYTTHNERGNKRRVYEYFTKAKPGDLILGYESTPIKKVIAIFEVTKGIHVDEDTGDEQISFIIQKFLPDPISWSDLKEMPELKDCEVLNNNQGSLFKVKKEEYDAILNREVEIEKDPYSMKQALSEIFAEEEQLNQILESLKYKKNIILQGPPGTGKTFMAKRLAYLLLEEKDDSKVEMVQFHQSYSYEDFMQGYRPNEDGSFKLENGVFFRFCKRAQADPDRDYFFIIDEINRGNLSKIFGELMLLIEKDKRGKKHSVSLTYTTSSELKFYIPKNVHLIGTMNTADRSLAVVDYALRRRFAFINVMPIFNEKFRNHLLNNADEAIVDKIIKNIGHLNSLIKSDKNLGNGFQIGHSYFCEPDTMNGDENWYRFVIENEIGPLLDEYWFDNLEMAENHKQNLLK